MIDPALPVTLVAARDRTIHYLDHDILASVLFAQRMAAQGAYQAHRQAVREACPELSGANEDAVAEMVARVLKARLPRVVSPRRRAARRVAA